MQITDEMVNRADSVLSRVKGGIPDTTIRLALEAALSAAEPQTAPSAAVKTLKDAANDVIACASDTYKKRNGHLANFEDESGEKCWIVPFDAFEALRSTLSAQVQDVASGGGMEFPEALTDDLRDVLSTMIWTSGQIAACLRAGGDQIKTRAEDEQAHVLHWLISLALKHGPEWRAKASERIKAIRDAAAPAKQEE